MENKKSKLLRRLAVIKRKFKRFSKRNKYGWGITAVYLLMVFVLYLYKASHTKYTGMELNEWGDFLAGVFSPIAFLWLVLGYMQQGEELKQNTEALKLQKDELNNLAISTHEQLILALAHQNHLAEQEKPEISLSVIPSFEKNSISGINNQDSMILRNAHAIAKNIKVIFSEQQYGLDKLFQDINVLNVGESAVRKIPILDNAPDNINITITYKDTSSRDYKKEFEWQVKRRKILLKQG